MVDILAYFMRLVLFFFLLLVSYAQAFEVQVSAKSAILINADTGKILFEKQAHIPMPPASITKVITALYALEKKGSALDEWVVASPDALWTVPPQVRRSNQHPPYRLEAGGSNMGLQVGEALPLRCLLYGLMLESGNDAANVIAEYVSGSVGQFVAELNLFVREKGCQNTRLFTPHGLPHPDHLTTAYDMAQLTRQALRHPIFCEVVSAAKYPRPETNKQPSGEISQFNALVKPGQFHYPKAIGVKTGYTIAAGFTLVAAAADEHRRLIAVLLGCEQMAGRYKDAIALFEAAFHEPLKSRVLFSSAFDRFTERVEGGKAPLEAHLEEDLVFSYYASEEPPIESKINWHPPRLPIEPGDVVGDVLILSHQECVMKAPLIASQRVEATWGYHLKQGWIQSRDWLRQHLAWILGLLGLCWLGLVGRRYT